jgi:hypothetical protein
MSAGAFVISRYESNELGGAIMPVRVQPETLLLFIGGTANSPSQETVNLGLFAQVGKNKGAYGVGCRHVTLRWLGAPPTGYKEGEVIRLPVMTLAAYGTYTPGSEGQYLGAGVVVVSRTPESAR